MPRRKNQSVLVLLSRARRLEQPLKGPIAKVLDQIFEPGPIAFQQNSVARVARLDALQSIADRIPPLMRHNDAAADHQLGLFSKSPIHPNPLAILCDI